MTDDAWRYLFLAAAALLAGACNSVAGGGTLLTFPALTAVVTGDAGAAIANATSTIALLPGSAAGAWGYRNEVKSRKRTVLLLLGPSLLGGLLGSLLVVWYPKQFETLIPWLILTAALLFLVQPVVSKVLKRKRPGCAPSNSAWAPAGVVVFQFFVALYGGYFGAGIGILMLAALGVLNVGDIHQMNGVKTVLATSINAASVAVFLATPGIIRWDYAAVMAAAAIAGGYLGARTARKLPPAYVRNAVVVIAFGLAGYYFWKQLNG